MKFVDKNDAKDAGHFQSVRHLLHHPGCDKRPRLSLLSFKRGRLSEGLLQRNSL
jgi:hypothetical protein